MPTSRLHQVAIARFASDLVIRLRRARIPRWVRTESQLERHFLIPVAARVARRHPGVLLCAHPMKGRRRCQPECHAAPTIGSRVLGCSRCSHDSKAWASVAAHGTHHTFDLAARRGSATFVVEANCLSARAGRMPNGEVQRLLGQCTLATARHRRVVGLLVYRGPLSAKWSAHTNQVQRTLRHAGVELVVRQI
jgi:hypothetical protein